MFRINNHNLRNRSTPIILLSSLLAGILLYTNLAQSPKVSYSLPADVLDDYTSPATHCFWPSQGENEHRAGGGAIEGEKPASEKVAGVRDKQKNTADGSWREWIPWTSSGYEDASENGDSAATQGESTASRFTWQGQLPDVIPVTGIERYMLAHIEELQEGYDAKHDLSEYGLKLGNISLAAYTSELLSMYREYLLPLHKSSTSSPKRKPSWLPPVLSRLSLRPPIAPLPSRPDQVITTDKSVDDLPWQFARWKEIMPEWEIKYFDDEMLKAWVKGVFGGSKAEKIWAALPRQVLKTDVFRYMAMLVEGGIYTDSKAPGLISESARSAAPIIHADLWGMPYHAETSPLLTHLSRLLSLSTSPHLPSSHPLSSFAPKHASGSLEDDVQIPSGRSSVSDGPLVDDGAELGPPALVVSVESDAIAFGWDNWRELGLSRAVQITQWTFMARPGHPVFLDVLGRTLKKSEEIALKVQEAKEKGEEFIADAALEWTGPGVFSDCVYRYLLARYGFKPEALIHKKEPLRVGDVLILPAGSYSSVSPFTDEKQRPWAASYHGFLGRWRADDPAVQEFERLKKTKEEAEEAEKKAKEEAEEAERIAKEAEDRAREAEKAEKEAMELAIKEGAEVLGHDGEGTPLGEVLGTEIEAQTGIEHGKERDRAEEAVHDIDADDVKGDGHRDGDAGVDSDGEEDDGIPRGRIGKVPLSPIG
ncbi:glycosyltransferase [Kwoniella heveanensis BCC8398]|uniref:Glycosyltransferase n=1 Tax=Kwoniella heveanensis BCC8398 TaxID=1296120 RepID=A0A1B9H0R5_9TREE|nr:glycosyltransferase [Kwoniella heveanensis BCC8398]